jgi:hypothetical protein
MRLPARLQDKVIDGMDRGELTLDECVALISKHHCQLSREAISNYYEAIRRRRCQLLSGSGI